MLQRSLVNKFEQGKLAHFYLLDCPLKESEARPFLNEWIEQYLFAALKKRFSNLEDEKIRNKLNLGHPDILKITTENKTYTISGGEFSEFQIFQSRNSIELGHKFIVVYDAYKITETLANKLLKSLEDAPKDVTIFFLDPLKREILPTISSRAIKLSVPIENKSENIELTDLDFLSWSEANNIESAHEVATLLNKVTNISDIIEGIKSKRIDEMALVKSIGLWLRQTKQSGETLSRYRDAIEELEKDQAFNNSSQNRVIKLMHTVFNL